jgi:hypothetical protein
MQHTFSTFLGVDAAAGRKPFTFVAIDPNRRLRVVGGGDAVDVLSFVAGQNNVLVALSPPWKGGKPADGSASIALLPACRLAGLHQPSLLDAAQPPACPPWMRDSLDLVTRLQEIGFQPFPQENAPRQWLEAPAETGFRALLGVPPFDTGILEGRIQRQLVLYDLELNVPDPMEFFEEVTRFRLLHSHLPYERVLPQAELNAWLAAAAAWLAVHEPARLQAAGSPADGITYHPIPKDPKNPA